MRAGRGVLTEISADCEIVIVDDASTDRTGALADEIAAARRVVVRVWSYSATDRKPQARGNAARRLRRRHEDLVAYTDTDLPFDRQELEVRIPRQSRGL